MARKGTTFGGYWRRLMNRRNKGFTLVEILIVVIILGILAAIVIPQFTQASDDARWSSLRSDVQTVRSQLELYRVENGSYPDDLATLVSGGYLKKTPVNPFEGQGFTYDANTGTFGPNGVAADYPDGMDPNDI
jgi:general secretion pathway protein G